jgi:hypothetical protein
MERPKRTPKPDARTDDPRMPGGDAPTAPTPPGTEVSESLPEEPEDDRGIGNEPEPGGPDAAQPEH